MPHLIRSPPRRFIGQSTAWHVKGGLMARYQRPEQTASFPERPFFFDLATVLYAFCFGIFLAMKWGLCLRF